MNADMIVSILVLAWAGMVVALPIAYVVVEAHKIREQWRVWRAVKALDEALQLAEAKDGDS